jgi:hypothetical protein
VSHEMEAGKRFVGHFSGASCPRGEWCVNPWQPARGICRRAVCC